MLKGDVVALPIAGVCGNFLQLEPNGSKWIHRTTGLLRLQKNGRENRSYDLPVTLIGL